MKIHEYNSIPDIPNKYADRILMECITFEALEKYLIKEDTSRILKFEKAKMKINPKKYTREEIKELGIAYIANDNKKSLYNLISHIVVGKVNESFATRLKEKNLTIDIFNDTKEFVNNINIILSDLDIFTLVSYIRIKHANLFEIVPSILKEWEESTLYINSKMSQYGYILDYPKRFSEIYKINLVFEHIDINVNKVNKSLDIKNINEEVCKSEIEPNIALIMNELKNINSKFINNSLDKNKNIELEKELKSKDKELKKVNKQLKEVTRENMRVNEELVELNIILNDKDKSIENLHFTIKSKTEKENEIKKKLNDLQKLIKENENSTKKRLNKLESELMEANKSIDNRDEEIVNLIKSNSILRKDIEVYISEIKTLKLTTSQLSDELNKKEVAPTIQEDYIKLQGEDNGWGIDDPWGIIENKPSY